MDNCDISVALEVIQVKGKNCAYLMNGHGCNDASIVDLDPGDSMLSYKGAPGVEKLWRLW